MTVGSRGDSYDNALAETVNGLYKAELIHARPAWPSVTEVEFATMNWVHWWNHQRLHQALDYSTPIEVEAACAETPEPCPRIEDGTEARALRPVRMLCSCTPAGPDDYFTRIGDSVEARAAPPSALTDHELEERRHLARTLAAKYRTERCHLALHQPRRSRVRSVGVRCAMLPGLILERRHP